MPHFDIFQNLDNLFAISKVLITNKDIKSRKRKFYEPPPFFFDTSKNFLLWK